MAMDPKVRAAQRRMLGYARTRGILDGVALVLWSEQGCGEWKADARSLSADLELLGVPHVVTVTRRIQPPWRSAKTKEPPERWEKVWVLWDDLSALVRWLPSVGKALETADVQPTAAPGVEIRFAEQGEPFMTLLGERILWTSS